MTYTVNDNKDNTRAWPFSKRANFNVVKNNLHKYNEAQRKYISLISNIMLK